MAPLSEFLDEPSYVLSIPHLLAVERYILSLALRFALIGRIDAARDFTEILYSRSPLQDQGFSGLRALVPYWRKTHFPTGVPDKIKTDAYFNDCISEKQQQGLQWCHYTPVDQRTEDEAGITAALSPVSIPYPQYRIPAQTVALDIAIKLAENRNVESSRDTKVLEVLAAIAERFPKAWELSSLIDSPIRVPVFMSGALARIWDFSDHELDSRAAQLLEASRQRFWYGPTTRGPETISGLLESCNDDTVTRTALDDEVDNITSLYKPPATEQEIIDLEERLGVTLPDDFKVFLRISNGSEGIWNGYFPGPPLRSTAEIDWLDYSEYELMFDQLNLMQLENELDSDEFSEFPIFTEVICIASEDIYDVWLIPPGTMEHMRDHYRKLYNAVDDHGKRVIERAIDDFAGSWDEWENLKWGCCSWACGGSAQLDSYKSFKAWLENEAWDAKNVGRESLESA